MSTDPAGAVSEELPPFPTTPVQDSGTLQRWGVTWPTTKDLLHSRMPDGYWTPWHLAEEQAYALRQQLAELQPMIVSHDPERRIYGNADTVELMKAHFAVVEEATKQLAELQRERDEHRGCAIALEQQLAEMRGDAARYQWLRAGGDYTLACINPEAGHICGENLDAVIDGAMKK